MILVLMNIFLFYFQELRQDTFMILTSKAFIPVLPKSKFSLNEYYSLAYTLLMRNTDERLGDALLRRNVCISLYAYLYLHSTF